MLIKWKVLRIHYTSKLECQSNNIVWRIEYFKDWIFLLLWQVYSLVFEDEESTIRCGDLLSCYFSQIKHLQVWQPDETGQWDSLTDPVCPIPNLIQFINDQSFILEEKVVFADSEFFILPSNLDPASAPVVVFDLNHEFLPLQ